MAYFNENTYPVEQAANMKSNKCQIVNLNKTKFCKITHDWKVSKQKKKHQMFFFDELKGRLLYL